MKEFFQNLSQYIIFILFLIFISLMRVIGLDNASYVCSRIFRLFGLYSQKGRIIRNNINHIYGPIDKTLLHKLEQEIWDNFGRYIGEFAFIDESYLSNSSRVEVVGADILKRLKSENKKYIVFSGHFANWDFILYSLLKHTGRVGVVYRKVNNKYIDAYLLNKRSMLGAKLIKKGVENARDMIQIIKNGLNLMMLVDQKMNEGIRIDFCGKPANTATGLANIALKYNYEIVPLKIERTHGAYFRISFIEPLEINHTGTQEEDIKKITIEINNILSSFIEERPGQWLWLHQRWGKPGEMKD
ncbi:MAG: hypothetical protein SFT68_05225 [Rickettsiaceae bacterium]|nr:hypothetical protein [Rickettsiaceae bacterium]